MKASVLLFAFVCIFSRLNAQGVDYNNLAPEFKDLAVQALNKVSPATKKWFADMAQQHADSIFNVAWAKGKLNGKFAAKDMDQMGELFVLMMAYLKMVQKEAREDRKLARSDKQIELIAKENKLEADNKKIEQQKREAAEKADRALEAANVQLVSGTVAGSSQIASSNTTGINNNPATLVKADSLKKLQQKANLQDQKIRQQELNAEKANEQKKANDDHKRAQKDAIKKLLDQIAELNRSSHI